jgi:hypothetical protein
MQYKCTSVNKIDVIINIKVILLLLSFSILLFDSKEIYLVSGEIKEMGVFLRHLKGHAHHTLYIVSTKHTLVAHTPKIGSAHFFKKYP